ncbi:hypothetical protein BLOT_014945 [Blomia tropicalis]|nr:hypothetical protein BLOT_014945 [Blomia tropicalis]
MLFLFKNAHKVLTNDSGTPCITRTTRGFIGGCGDLGLDIVYNFVQELLISHVLFSLVSEVFVDPFV